MRATQAWGRFQAQCANHPRRNRHGASTPRLGRRTPSIDYASEIGRQTHEPAEEGKLGVVGAPVLHALRLEDLLVRS